MKITYLLRPDGGLYFGGAEVQALQTAAAVRKLGIQVEISNSESTDVGDVVHAFASYPSHISTLEYCKARGIPFVFSTIFYKKADFKFQLMRERLRSLRRHNPAWVFRRLVQESQAIIPNSHAEADQINSICDLQSTQVFVIPNAAEERFAKGQGDLFRQHYGITEPFILNVARIEKRKNQLRLIQAALDTNTKLVLIGKEDMGDYSRACRALANNSPNIIFIPPIPHDSDLLASAYAAARVFALPSLLETPGISALEAGLAGASIVTTPIGGGREYFGDMAHYVHPNSTQDIQEKIKLAWQKDGHSNQLRDHILQNYTWDAVGRKTVAVYEQLVNNKNRAQ